MTWAMPSGSGETWADDYERGRPGWPPAVVDVPGLTPAATVVDVGAGTGKLTRLLTEVFAHVIAVEPSEAMRARLVHACPAVEIVAGRGQELPLPAASVDAVFAAQAFHWFDDEQAGAELARVLRPQGALVLMWNVPAGPFTPSVADVEELLLRHVPPGDLGYDPLDLGDGRKPALPQFTELTERRLPNPQTLDRQGLVSYYASMGWLADLPDDERLPLLDAIRVQLTADEYERIWETTVYLGELLPDRDV
jgi:SAM-dependent methyltransferase